MPTSHNVIPQSAADVISVLQSIPSEKDTTKLAFGIAGAITIVSWKANLFHQRASDTERFSFFFKFTASIDPNLSLSKTLIRLSGVFLNYVQNKTANRLDSEAQKILNLLMTKLGEVAAGDESQRKRIMHAMLQVRNACYTYVLFSWDWTNNDNGKFRDLDEAVRTMLGQ